MLQTLSSLALLGIASTTTAIPADMRISLRSPQTCGQPEILHNPTHNWGNITVGKKDALNFRALFDTGSGNMWIPSYANTTGGYNFVGTNLNKNYSVTYGSGVTDAGPVYQDDVWIAGIVAEDMHFAVVNKTGKVADVDANNAVIGMEYRTQSNNHDTPLFFDSLVKQNKVNETEFGVYLAPKTQNTTNGVLTLGGRDPTKFTGEMVSTPVIAQGYW